jgi:PAS domain S-box-containing protein
MAALFMVERDMTRSEHADHNIALGEAEFRELADNAPVMIWRSSETPLRDWFNRPWQAFAGKSHEQLLGYGWAEDLHPDDFHPSVALYQEAFEARQAFTLPYRLRRQDGTYRWFLDKGAPFYRQGEFAGFFGSCTDITDQKDLETHQQVLLAELDHRVKNNLQLIIAFLQMSKIRATGDEAKELLESAIGRIQGVGAVQAELHRSATGFVDLAVYLPNLIRASIQAESGNAADLRIEAEPINVPFKLASDLGLITNELITNAIKHGGNDAPCAIRFGLKRLDNGRLQLSIGDSGKGFRADQLSSAGATGSSLRGLGLIGALAKRCNAELARTNDLGALVTVTVPLP